MGLILSSPPRARLMAFHPGTMGMAPALDERVSRAIADGAWRVFSLSGGKDSTAVGVAVNALLQNVFDAAYCATCDADTSLAEFKLDDGQPTASAQSLGTPISGSPVCERGEPAACLMDLAYC